MEIATVSLVEKIISSKARTDPGVPKVFAASGFPEDVIGTLAATKCSVMVSAIKIATLKLVNSTREIAQTRLQEKRRRNVLSSVQTDISGIRYAIRPVTTKSVIMTTEIAPVKKDVAPPR